MPDHPDEVMNRLLRERMRRNAGSAPALPPADAASKKFSDELRAAYEQAKGITRGSFSSDEMFNRELFGKPKGQS
jgi:hypothetical protein